MAPAPTGMSVAVPTIPVSKELLKELKTKLPVGVEGNDPLLLYYVAANTEGDTYKADSSQCGFYCFCLVGSTIQVK